MEQTAHYQAVIDKLNQGMPFGLFEDGNKCYFQDGEKVGYTNLWIALRAVHHLGTGIHNKTLLELCPDTFEGTFPYKFSKHTWKKK